MAVKLIPTHAVPLRDLVAYSGPAREVVVTGRLLAGEDGQRLADGVHTIPVRDVRAPEFAWVAVTGVWAGGLLLAERTVLIRAPEQSPAGSWLPEALLARQPRRITSILSNAAMLKELRGHLDAAGFVEVKTPMLQAAPEISFCQQGRTQPMHGTVFHLRTDPEEYLKRYLTAGLDSVYEISTNIRDDADDDTHLTEFQSLEFYRRLMSFDEALGLADELIRRAAARLGDLLAPRPVGLSSSRPYPQVRYAELTRQMSGIDIAAPACATAVGLAEVMRRASRDVPPSSRTSGWRRDLLDGLFDEHVLPRLREPMWVTHFPADLAYSYRLDPDDPRWTLRAELYLPGGLEIAHVYENLTVEPDLRARYNQRRAHRVDAGLGQIQLNEALMESARIGMPPMGGGAIGIERLLMSVLGEEEIGSGALFAREISLARAAITDEKESS